MTFRFKALITTASLLALVSGEAWAQNNWLKGVSVDGVIKIAGSYLRDYDEVDSSDIIVHTAILGINAQPAPWVKGRMSFKYEENKTDLTVDDGYITLGDHAQNLPFYARFGSMVVPFGKFTTNMNSDSLTLVLGESAEKAAQFGFNLQGAYGSIFAYNGATQDDGNNTIDHYGANLGFTKTINNLNIDIGASYLLDIGDTGTLSNALVDSGVNFGADYDYVAGIGAHLVVTAGPVTFIGEYIAALDEFKPEQLSVRSSSGADTPEVFNAELGVTFNAVDKPITLAIGYQQTSDAEDLTEARFGFVPETRMLGTIGMGIFDNTRPSLEYALSEDYDEENGGTGEDAQNISMVLAVTF